MKLEYIKTMDTKLNNGFSFIEIIIYLFLSLMLSNIASISLSVIERQKMICCAKELQNNLRYCQKNSMDEKRSYEIKINDENNFYEIKCSGGEDNIGSSMGVISKVNLPVGIKLNSNFSSGEIIYKKTGTIQNGGTIKIYGNKYAIKIVINVSTGRARLEQIQKK